MATKNFSFTIAGISQIKGITLPVNMVLSITTKAVSSQGLDFILGLENNNPFTFRLFDISGRTIWSNISEMPVSNPVNSNYSYLTVKSLIRSGTYFVLLEQNNAKVSKKVTIIE